MPTFRAQVSWNMDSALPRDSLECVLHFDRVDVPGGPALDWSAIANDIATLFDLNWNVSGCEIVVKLYDLSDALPRPVKATATKRPGLHPASAIPREIALCLSFYGDRNMPRERGRIFLPAVCGISQAALSGRPQWSGVNNMSDKAIGLASTANSSLPDIGGIDVKHGIWSPTTQRFVQAKHYWVDDEWDTIRKRGLRATTRKTATREG